MAGFFVRLVLLWSVASAALALDAATGQPVLVVSGNIAITNGNGVATFDAAMLDALPQHEIVTQTPWYPVKRTFSGPLLRDLLSRVGARGEDLEIRALNDYRSTLPSVDARNYDVVLTRRIDGKLLRVRDRGPVFIMYPFDQHSELKTDTYYNRSVWQVKRIHVK